MCSGQGLRYRFAYTTGQSVQRAQEPGQQPATRRTRKRIPSATAAATFVIYARSLPQGHESGGRTGDDAAVSGGRHAPRKRRKTRAPRHLCLSQSAQIAVSVGALGSEPIAPSPYNGLSPIYARSHWLFEYCRSTGPTLFTEETIDTPKSHRLSPPSWSKAQKVPAPGPCPTLYWE
jgi:hypothetical protein